MSVGMTYSNYGGTWNTPQPWLEWAADCLGEFFDPCPKRWDPTLFWNGLETPWDRVDPGFPSAYINHPGSGRGNAQQWWSRTIDQCIARPFIWCAFNVEQLRYLNPSPLELPGWLVAPRSRLKFVWGGPDLYAGPNKKLMPFEELPLDWQRGGPKPARQHGQPCTSPSNWTVFWTSDDVEIAKPPEPCIITRTGVEMLYFCDV